MWRGCGQRLPIYEFTHHIRERHLMHQESSGSTKTGKMEEARRTRESPSKFPDIGRPESSEHLPPDSEADEGIEDPDMQRDTLQIERNDAGSSHARTAPSPQVLAEEENAELQDDSPYSAGSKSELMALPLGGAGAERGDPATGNYSRKVEGDVLGSHVFRGEVEEKREDVDPQSSRRERNVNESELEVFQTGDAVTERGDSDPPSHPSHSASKESQPNPCIFLFRSLAITLHRYLPAQTSDLGGAA
ncbi:hypothetical protein EDD15DRAFT_310438 [Pisolithus albus]|nr:hypothetical protein EDD15DRAFT_310438 [Pisolithus albus]